MADTDTPVTTPKTATPPVPHVIRTFHTDAKALGHEEAVDVRHEKNGKSVVKEQKKETPIPPQPVHIKSTFVPEQQTKVSAQQAPVLPETPPAIKGVTIKLAERDDIKARVEKARESLSGQKEIPKETPPPPPPKPPEPLVLKDAEAIQTFKTDTEKRIQEKQLSPVHILAKETDAKNPQKRAPRKQSSMAFVFGISAFLIVAGGSLIVGSYLLVTSQTPVAITPRVESPIRVEHQVSINGEALIDDIVQQQSAPLKEGDLTQLYVSESSIPLSRLFVLLQAPNLLARSLINTGMIGLYGKGDRGEPFIIVSLSSFESVFKGMLDWEAKLPETITPLFGTLDRTPEEPISSTTPTFFFAPIFKDTVISNIDTRILRDAKGDIHMIYGFPQKELLVIAGSEEAFRTILERLAN